MQQLELGLAVRSVKSFPFTKCTQCTLLYLRFRFNLHTLIVLEVLTAQFRTGCPWELLGASNYLAIVA